MAAGVRDVASLYLRAPPTSHKRRPSLELATIFSLHSRSRHLGQLDLMEYSLHFHFKPDIALRTQQKTIIDKYMYIYSNMDLGT